MAQRWKESKWKKDWACLWFPGCNHQWTTCLRIHHVQAIESYQSVTSGSCCDHLLNTDQVRAAKPSIPRDQSRRNPSKDEWHKDSKNQPNQSQSYFRKIHGRRTWKSPNDLEFEEVQGFLELGFTFNKEDISPSVINIIPGLQEKRMTDSNKVKIPYLSEAWLVRRSNPPLLNLLDRKSPVEVKEQLKVWAKTVAFRASQEC